MFPRPSDAIRAQFVWRGADCFSRREGRFAPRFYFVRRCARRGYFALTISAEEMRLRPSRLAA
jgi:hypothetical protein